MHNYNQKFIKNLSGNEVRIQAEDFESDTNNKVSLSTKIKIRKFVKKNLWDEELVIKEGCVVRLLRNIDVKSGWVNSKRARVFRAALDGSYIVLQDLDDSSKQLPLTKIRQPFKLGSDLYYRYQYPLILGYATTVHAVQGTTVTCKYVDLDRSFWESGQAFVALSRPKDISQLHLLNTYFEKVQLKPYYKNLLDWMTEVDEIAIMHKPRFHGDFPLIVADGEDNLNAEYFPNFRNIVTKSEHKPKNDPFKPPRSKLVKRSDICTSSNNIENQINHRLYKIADAFNNACHGTGPALNKIRFATKFMDEVLVDINNTLSIHNVVDPLLQGEEKMEVSEHMLKKWDEQKILR